ncbi:hypothetical protein BH09GEM1_BH09GEM1_01000 [soil metagenome]
MGTTMEYESLGRGKPEAPESVDGNIPVTFTFGYAVSSLPSCQVSSGSRICRRGLLRRFAALALAAIAFAGASTASAQTQKRIQSTNKFVGTLSESSTRQGGSGLPYEGYTFTARAGERMTITLFAGSFASYVFVGQTKDGIFTLLASASAAKAGETAKLDVAFPAAGDYVIAASSKDHDPRGAYTINIVPFAAPVAQAWFTVPVISFDSAPPAPGELRWFDFVARNRLTFTGVWGPDRRTVYVASSVGIHQSDDGGATWRQSLVGGDAHPKNNMSAVWGRSKDDVYAVGATIQHTTDGGKTWSELATSETSGMKGGLGSIWGRGDHVYAVGTFPVLLQSADRGATWTRIPSITTSGDWVFGNDEAVFILTYGVVWASADEGKTWNKVTDLKEKLDRVWGIGEDLYGIGEDGLLVHHVRGGGWTKMKSPARSIRDVWGVSPTDFFLAGIDPKSIDPTLFHTRDGGKTWTSARLAERAWRLWGVSADDFWIGGAPGIAHGLSAAGFAAARAAAQAAPTAP